MYVANNKWRAGIARHQGVTVTKVPIDLLMTSMKAVAVSVLNMVFQLLCVAGRVFFCQLLLCRDIHLNPGPAVNKSLKFFHWNLNSLPARGRIKILRRPMKI